MGHREDKVVKTRKELGRSIVRSNIPFGSDLLNAIEAYIDAKITVAKAELKDRIRQNRSL